MLLNLIVTDGPLSGREFSFTGRESVLIGRSPRAQVRLPEDDPRCSRAHCIIEIEPPACRLVDMGSKNGTRVNGERVTEVELKDGDEIQAGHTRLRVELSDITPDE